MFSLSGLLSAPKKSKLRKDGGGGSRLKKSNSKRMQTECIGKAINLSLRHPHDAQEHHLPNPYGYACSLRCKHPAHITKDRRSSGGSHIRARSEDFIPEHIYKKYTETDSRPITPDLNRRSVSVPRSKRSTADERRRCITPEPETRQCQFHHRRILILDLRRVKSVDAIGRQESRTPGTSLDSTYGDDDAASSSMLFQFSPRNLSLSRSATPKTKQKKGKKKSKERSTSPIAYERSTSPKILEGLTLPPLHSSVLTLLGQRGIKASPRGLIGAAAGLTAAESSTGATRHKKLRRHGRTRNKGGDKEKNEDNISPEKRAGSEEVKKTDDPRETQISTINNGAVTEDEKLAQQSEVENKSMENMKQNLKSFKESRKALYHVLQDYLAGKPWSPQETEALDNQIEEMSKDFQKLETKFQTHSIQLKESTWLGFPRTWSRTSATFGVPIDARSLKTMKPLEYLEHYVTISGPRRHLYCLVFQRYRTMENPTGKFINLKILQSALSEILGRSFSQEEMTQLCHHYLGLDDPEFPIFEENFLGISAFCERIYAEYSLEDNHECFECLKIPTRQKYRCHQNQKSDLEKVDLSYLYTKLRNGQVQNQLSNLILALCDRD